MVRISGVDTDQENLQYILKQGHTLLMDDGLLAPRYFPKLYVHLHQVVQTNEEFFILFTKALLVFLW